MTWGKFEVQIRYPRLPPREGAHDEQAEDWKSSTYMLGPRVHICQALGACNMIHGMWPFTLADLFLRLHYQARARVRRWKERIYHDLQGNLVVEAAAIDGLTGSE